MTGPMRTARVLVPLLIFIGLFNAGLTVATAVNAGVGWDAGIDTLSATQVMSVSPDAELRDAYEEVFLTSELLGNPHSDRRIWIGPIAGRRR